jgi:two-component system, NtrC family, sensor kinase
MLIAIAIVTGLAWGDEQREADAALRDLETEQSILASSLATGLGARLASIGRDPTRIGDARVVDLGLRAGDLVDVGTVIEHRSDTLVLLKEPYDAALHTLDGRNLHSAPLLGALDRGATGLRVTREEAAEVGLPARTSVAGVARVDAGVLGRWGVIVVTSAAGERDREKRAQRRLVLSVLVASGLVLAFGGAALRKQRKELELQRELAVAEAQHQRDDELLQAERVATMGTFAMGVAHEVSTPLGIIVGRAEQLTSGLPDRERTERNAQAILKQAGRIQHIVRRFLDMARGGPPALARTDPAFIVRAAASAVEHRFAKARVVLQVDVPEAMPTIQCDRDLLEQAIVNLLLNACEASGAGGQVEVAARADAEQVAFVVSDDGAGISPENAARATEPFFTTKAAGSGSGLGLAIATEIVKSHRGDLTIAPRDGNGTRARIEIPIAGGGSNGQRP